MNRFSKILCYAEPVEQSKDALVRAIEMARSHQASLSLVSIINSTPILAPELKHGFVDIRKSELDDLLESVDSFDVDVNVQVIVGELGALHIIEAVLDEAYDLVIKPTDNAGVARSILFGSNDLHLLRKCPVPVWIVKAQKQPRLDHILAAVDVDPEEKENAELNTQILQLALSLCEQYGSELHIVHAWELYGEDLLRSARSPLPQAHVDQMLEDARKNHQHWFNQLLASVDLSALASKIHLKKGTAEEVISQLVAEKHIDLTIMGTVARTGIPGFFIGNTAERILTSIDCSVMAVKPGAFKSPVKH